MSSGVGTGFLRICERFVLCESCTSKLLTFLPCFNRNLFDGPAKGAWNILSYRRLQSNLLFVQLAPCGRTSDWSRCCGRNSIQRSARTLLGRRGQRRFCRLKLSRDDGSSILRCLLLTAGRGGTTIWRGPRREAVGIFDASRFLTLRYSSM